MKTRFKIWASALPLMLLALAAIAWAGDVSVALIPPTGTAPSTVTQRDGTVVTPSSGIYTITDRATVDSLMSQGWQNKTHVGAETHAGAETFAGGPVFNTKGFGAGSGVQVARMASPITMCTTSNSVGASCAEPTYTLVPGFADTAYAAFCFCSSIGTNLPYVSDVIKASNTLVVNVKAATAASASCAEVDCILSHD